MGSFQAYHDDIRDPGVQPRIAAQLRDRGLVTFSGIGSRAELVAIAKRLMAIRPHRDAGPDGVTVITSTNAEGSGYAAFTDAGLIPHTDGSSVPDPPGLLLLACQEPAAEGGWTQVVDGARVIATLAEQCPAALGALSAPRAASFGSDDGYTGTVFEPAGPGRTRIRLRLDELARFSPAAADAIPLLRAAIASHTQTFQLGAGEGILLGNTRWRSVREPRPRRGNRRRPAAGGRSGGAGRDQGLAPQAPAR